MTGAAIMIVEILGAKMLSPYLGTSHFVWTAQIAVTLVALACGYYAGGRMVDRSLRLGRLYLAILIAGVYLALTVAICEPVAYACLKANLAVGSLLTSAFLFFVPLALLAMVGPFVIRILTVSVTGVGGNVGRLTAISTLGSFVGTVLIGYLLIPYLANSITMYLTALVLLLLASGYFFGWERKPRATAAAAFLLVAGAALGYGGIHWQSSKWNRIDELFHGNSNFGQLQVLQDRDTARRFYLNDYLTQNTYDTGLKQSLSMFTYMLHELPRAYTPRVDDVLCIGLGVGIVPMEFAREGVRVDVVEINPAVVPLGKKFFDLEPDKLNITIGDGRDFVNRCAKRYDAVVLDAFLGDSCPSHLMTREAFTAMRRVLKPDGTLVINTFAELDGREDFFAASLSKTLRAVFPSVRIHQARAHGNTLFVASNRTNLVLLREPDYDRMHSAAAPEVRAAFSGLREANPNHGLVLTDDYNPVEFFDAPNRERLRQALAFSVRRWQRGSETE